MCIRPDLRQAAPDGAFRHRDSAQWDCRIGSAGGTATLQIGLSSGASLEALIVQGIVDPATQSCAAGHT